MKKRSLATKRLLKRISEIENMDGDLSLHFFRYVYGYRLYKLGSPLDEIPVEMNVLFKKLSKLINLKKIDTDRLRRELIFSAPYIDKVILNDFYYVVKEDVEIPNSANENVMGENIGNKRNQNKFSNYMQYYSPFLVSTVREFFCGDELKNIDSWSENWSLVTIPDKENFFKEISAREFDHIERFVLEKLYLHLSSRPYCIRFLGPDKDIIEINKIENFK